MSDINYKQKIIDAGIMFSIKSISEQVFSQWIVNATTEYQLSPKFINKIQEENTEKIFLEKFIKAIKVLTEEKSDEKKSIKGWSFGFIFGYMQGALHTHWFNQFILHPSTEYEN